MFDSILVVCTGNLSLADWRAAVASVATGKTDNLGRYLWAGGQPGGCQRSGRGGRHGISLEGHRARKLTPQIMRESDLILVMEPAHLRFISDLAPEIRGKSLLLGNGWGRRTSPIPIVKVVKRSIMFSVCWAKPVRNGLIV